MLHADIRRDALRQNLMYFKQVSGCNVMPVIKANGYGHGLIETARFFRAEGCEYLAVATLDEAFAIRASGDTGRILIWLYYIHDAQLQEAVDLDIDIAVFDENHIPVLRSFVPSGKRAKITLNVNTGMNQSSISYEAALQAARTITNAPELELVGLMSHLASSEHFNHPSVHTQLAKFHLLRMQLAEEGIRPPLIHIGNTEACMNYDMVGCTHVRPGSGLYGFSTNPICKGKLAFAMSVRSVIVHLKTIEEGQAVGYNALFVAPKRMRIAVVLGGYADLIPKAARTMVLYVRGEPRKVLGMISMDQLTIEATDDDVVGDTVEIFGDGHQSVYDLARAAGVTVSEIMVNIGPRVNRAMV